MSRRQYICKYDSVETLREAVRSLERVLEKIKHKTPRASVIGAIRGVSYCADSLVFDAGKTKLLKSLRKQKDEKSRSAATQKWQRWTDDEDRLVMESPMTDFEIGQILGRSRMAVSLRRGRLYRKKVAA